MDLKIFRTLKANTTEYSEQPWLVLTILGADILLCDRKLLDICINNVWSRLRTLAIDTTVFGQCISLFSGEISIKKKEIDDLLTSTLLDLVSKELVQVSEIPKQYRWTRKPMPNEHSSYLPMAFEVTERFVKEAEKFGWDEEVVASVHGNIVDQAIKVFREKAEQVMQAEKARIFRFFYRWSRPDRVCSGSRGREWALRIKMPLQRTRTNLKSRSNYISILCT